MIRSHGLHEVSLVTVHAVRGHTLEAAHLRTLVTSKARSSSMGAHEREARARMLRDSVLHQPVGLAVAARALAAHACLVWVFMAASAATHTVELHRSAVVVAAQALRAFVRSHQRIARLLRVVIDEVLANGGPVVAFMTQRAIGGERVVGHYRPAQLVPLLCRDAERRLALVDGTRQERKGRSQQQEREMSALL